jgi:antitoxin PrlF
MRLRVNGDHTTGIARIAADMRAKSACPTAGDVRRDVVCITNKKSCITRIAMPTTVTSKGQVTIPKPIRDRLGIKPGTKVAFGLDKEGRAFLQTEDKMLLQPSRFERLRGTAARRLSTDEIMALTRGEPA